MTKNEHEIQEDACSSANDPHQNKLSSSDVSSEESSFENNSDKQTNTHGGSEESFLSDNPENITRLEVSKTADMMTPDSDNVEQNQPSSLSDEDAQKNQMDAKNPKEKKKLSKGALIGIIAAAVVVVIILAIVLVNSALERQAKDDYNRYIDNLIELSSEGIDAASQAEKICNTAKRIWSSAIWDGDRAWDSDIQKYHSDDFNEALQAYHLDTTTIELIAKMEVAYDSADDLLKQLKDPPEGLEDAYLTAQDFMAEVETLVNLASDPSGSLQTYSNAFNEADTACVKEFKALQKEIPEKKD